MDPTSWLPWTQGQPSTLGATSRVQTGQRVTAQALGLKVQAAMEKPICPRRVCCTIYFNLHQAMHIKFR